MENFNIKIRKMSLTSIIFSLIFIATGIFLLMRPETAINIVCYVIGVILILWGVISIIQFFSNKNSKDYLSVSFIFGSFVFIFGIIVLIKPNIIASIIPLLLGIWMVINGVTKLSYALTINKENNAALSIIGSIAIIILGILMIFNPFEGAQALTQIIGISFIFYSILDLAECIIIKFNLKSKDSYDEDKIIEAEYREVEKKETKKEKNQDKKD